VNSIRIVALCFAAAAAVSAFGDTGTPSLDLSSSKSIAADGVELFPVPKVGVRVGFGNWNEVMVEGGVDVTFKVPILPVPALRIDGEIWGKPGSFGQDRRGNALSLMGVQTFVLGYAAVGPTFYFADDEGDHQSGIGLKALGGLSLPHSMYVEAAIILGPKLPPIFFTIGQRF
jgi:hypothetical protein